MMQELAVPIASQFAQLTALASLALHDTQLTVLYQLICATGRG